MLYSLAFNPNHPCLCRGQRFKCYDLYRPRSLMIFTLVLNQWHYIPYHLYWTLTLFWVFKQEYQHYWENIELNLNCLNREIEKNFWRLKQLLVYNFSCNYLVHCQFFFIQKRKMSKNVHFAIFCIIAFIKRNVSSAFAGLVFFCNTR